MQWFNGSFTCEHNFLTKVLGTSIGKKSLKESTQPDWTTNTKSPGSGNKKRIDHSNSLKLPCSKHGLEYISYQCENTYMRVNAAPPAYVHHYSPACVATKYLAVFASSPILVSFPARPFIRYNYSYVRYMVNLMLLKQCVHETFSSPVAHTDL